MKIDINKRTVGIAAGVTLTLAVVWWSVSSVNRTVRKDNTCELNCSEYKHEVIGGGCFCATDWGWIRAGQVARVVAKMKEKCEPARQKKKRR